MPDATAGRSATAAEVARLAGVSAAVVSYVINDGPRPVAAETAERVRQAMATLGYRPNRSARALRTGTTGIIGLVVPGATNPFFGEYADAVHAVARERSLDVITASSGGDLASERALVADLADRGVDGLLVATSMGAADVGSVPPAPVPLVLTNCPFEVPGVSAVGPDAEAGAYDVVSHLALVHGHRSVAMVTGERGTRAAARGRGWKRALRTHGASAGPVVRVPFSRAGGATGARRLLEEDERPSAVFVTSDAQAIGVLHGLRRAGVRVPEDVAVVTFDGTEDAAYAAPPLTLVRQPVVAMVEAALDALADPGVVRHRLFAMELVVRESCGCRPVGPPG